MIIAKTSFNGTRLSFATTSICGCGWFIILHAFTIQTQPLLLEPAHGGQGSWLAVLVHPLHHGVVGHSVPHQGPGPGLAGHGVHLLVRDNVEDK